eukprot:jgi/Galph1/5753/GphlegSOOS_G4414.1
MTPVQWVTAAWLAFFIFICAFTTTNTFSLTVKAIGRIGVFLLCIWLFVASVNKRKDTWEIREQFKNGGLDS